MSMFVCVGMQACMHVYVSVAPTLALCRKLLMDIDLDLDRIVPEEDLFLQPVSQRNSQI